MSAKEAKIQKEGNSANKSADIIAKKSSGAPELAEGTKDLSVEADVDCTVFVPSTPDLESQTRKENDIMRSSAGTSKNPLLKLGMQLFTRLQRSLIYFCILFKELLVLFSEFHRLL